VTALAAGASLASQVEPGVLGFSIVAGIGVVLFFLLRSMNKQLRKVSADRQYFSANTGLPERQEVLEGTVFAEGMDLPERTGADPAVTREHRGGTGQDMPRQ
jgi:hypothetical protein